jgi:glycosyltransferase involved in cell wall biosynthesis
MRIVILANVPVWTLPGLGNLRHQGHYATWLEPLVPAFSDYQDLEIHWITMCKETDHDLTHQAHGQTFHILHRGSKAVQMATGYFGEIRRIRKLVHAIQPDLVHAWGSEDVYGLAAAFGYRCENKLFTLQGCLTDYLRLLGGNWLFRLQTFYEKPTIRHFHHGTAESPAAKQALLSINPTMDVSLVDYGVNPEFFSTPWQPRAEPTVVFVGAVTKRKGLHDLMDVAKHPDLSHICFKIVGSGDLLDSLKLRSPANVEWLGRCDRQQVTDALASSWCLFMPTYADTGPTVVKEARVIGLPVVCTTGAGAACYIDDQKSGFITEPGMIDDMVAAIKQICASREQCIRMGKHSWDDARHELHPATTAAKFCDLYRKFLVDS